MYVRALRNRAPCLGLKIRTLNVAVEYPQAELVQLALDVAEDTPLEDLALREDLLHRHAGYEHTGFTLDNALDDILEELALSRLRVLLGLAVGQKNGVFHQCVATVLPPERVFLLAGSTAIFVGIVDRRLFNLWMIRICSSPIYVWADCEHDGELSWRLAGWNTT